MKTKLPESINSIEEAKKLLEDLHTNGESYHPEDSAVYALFANGTASLDEAHRLDDLMDQIDKLEGFDSCAFLLDLVEENINCRNK